MSLCVDGGIAVETARVGTIERGSMLTSNKAQRSYRGRRDFDAIIAARNLDLLSNNRNTLALLQRAYCYFKQGVEGMELRSS